MDIKQLQTLVIDALEDVKGQDIVIFDTVHLTSLFDRIAIVSGTSNRQTKALAASVRDKVKEAGGDIIGIEGEDTGEWVLVDLGDMIVHIMQAPIRAYYRLEEIWGDKPVKLGAAKRAPSKRSAEGDEPKKTGGHLAASKAKVETAPVIEKKAPAKKAAATKAKAADAKAKPKAAAKAEPNGKPNGEPKAKKAATPEGKTIKVASTKSATAAANALKALPPKAKPVKVAKPAADAVLEKKVIKRVVKKVAAE